ncbi:amino acid transporter [Microbacterium sp. P03]|uniref:amino acid transporter n=1 Tax=Microbacterium sp. P03 TaxID=3366946 RepID=UPI003745C038
MTDPTPKPTTRRDLMKPVQLLAFAFGAALFAGVVTLISMGFFQQREAGQSERALVVGAIVFGVTFIVVLVGLALMLLAVDPAQVTKGLDRPVLLDKTGDHNAPDTSPSGETKPRG